jgi:hypothetical protein
MISSPPSIGILHKLIDFTKNLFLKLPTIEKTMQNRINPTLFILALLLSSLTPFSYDRPPENPRLLKPIKKLKNIDIINQKALPSIFPGPNPTTLGQNTPNSPLVRLLGVSSNCKTPVGGPTCDTCHDNTGNIFNTETAFDQSLLAETYDWNDVKFIDRSEPFTLDQKDSKCRMVCAAGHRTAFDTIGNYDSQKCTQAFCRTFDYVGDTCTSCWENKDYEGLAHDTWGAKKFISRAEIPMLYAAKPFIMNYGDSNFQF